jgi:uncharacterized protein
LRRIESHFIAGPAGRLEALLEQPENEPTQAWLVCHPHPLYRGTMHNKVVYRIARATRSAGAVTLRFNFRGVGSSEGVYDEGVGEVEDARAALAFLRERCPALPFSLAGFSFGSRVILKLGCSIAEAPPGEQPRKLVAAGVPAGVQASQYRLDFLGACTLPKYFVQSANDEYGPAADMRTFFATVAGPKELRFIEARDHFFGGGLDAFEEAVAAIAGK